jgi:hypothetical protein
MSMTTHPCHLFVIPACSSPFAIILRRGPSKWYHIVRWRTDNDTFEMGAWFKGRIYEEKCDLSPDGRLLVYFCHGGAYRPEYTDSWTAVSRAPWLYALGLWPQGTTYGGGGRFIDNRSLILSGVWKKTPHPDHPARGLTITCGNADSHQSTGEVEDADWSGRDHAGRLIFSRLGRLLRRDSFAQDHEIADFNALRPDPQPAPAWAREPLA